MPPAVIFVFVILLFGLAGTFLIGQQKEYRHRERLQSGGDPDALARLQETVEQLQAEVEALQAGTASLEERLEFNERLLAGPRDGTGAAGRSDS